MATKNEKEIGMIHSAIIISERFLDGILTLRDYCIILKHMGLEKNDRRFIISKIIKFRNNKHEAYHIKEF